jgi:hypothetical protein
MLSKKELRNGTNSDSCLRNGRRVGDDGAADHLLRRINVFATAVLADLHEQLKTFYSDIGRPSIDPELMMDAPGRLLLWHSS